MDVDSFTIDGVHYRKENVRCGKKRCRSCPHGPYWFAYSRVQGKMKKDYVGKVLPLMVQRLFSMNSQLRRRRRPGDRQDRVKD